MATTLPRTSPACAPRRPWKILCLRPTQRAVPSSIASFLLLLATARLPIQAQESDPAQQIAKIDAAVRARTAAISGYTVKEQYSVYRNGEKTPSVQVNVLTTYDRATGKDYKVISQTGSDFFRRVIIDKVIASEKEMAKAENHEIVSVTSANYDIQPDPAGIQQQNGHDCIVMKLKAKRKVTYLFNGRAWFDAHDFTLVHLEGSPAQSVSFFAGETTGTRDYDKLNGFSMATRAKVHSHSFLFGNTELSIDYTDYQIQLDPKATPPPQ